MPAAARGLLDLTFLRTRERLILPRSRSVSNGPGSRLLTVTLRATACARMPGDEAGQPGARAVGQAQDPIGAFTAPR